MTIHAYPCIGGPLAGQYANASDFLGRSRFLGSAVTDRPEDGQYAEYAGEYLPYEWPVGSGNEAGDFPPRRVYLHQSVLKPTKKAGDR